MHILNNWKVIQAVSPDGRPLICIEGRVYGSNPRFPGSSLIRTSSVTGYHLEASSMVIITSRGSEYLLGKPDPSEDFTEFHLMGCLPKKGQAARAPFDGTKTQVLAHAPHEDDETVMVSDAPVTIDVKPVARPHRHLS